jgi:hypothetical protein
MRRAAVLLGLIFGLMGDVAGLAWAQDASPSQPQRKAPIPHVGSAMAVLATLEQARVLPQDNTPEANRIIKSVIQFQSAFAKSDNPSVQNFAAHAWASKYGEPSDVKTHIHHAGWTPQLLEALADAEARTPVEEMQQLASGFQRFNLSTNDFHQFMLLVREARTALSQQGLNFHQVFASYRQTMPGASQRQ